MFASTVTAFNVQNYEIQQYETNSRLRRISCELQKLSESYIPTNALLYTIIQGYYKRNRHFQCCIETKLLMIYPKYLLGFVVHVFKFI